MRVHATVFAVALLGSTWAHAASDIEKFESKVGKVAAKVSDVFEKPKGLCVCLNDVSPDDIDAAGVLDRAIVGVAGGQRVRVRCMVRRFDNTGNSAVAVACDNWVPITK
jgi:hypothetical protein